MPRFRLKKTYSQVGSDLKKVKGTLALLASLPRFFREPLTLERAEDEIKRALENREGRFLDLVHSHVYSRPGSPYLRLFRLAGCEFADLQASVRAHGLEKTLEQLAEEGVYLTSEEFKGKREVVRGGCSFRVDPGVFELRGSSPGFVTQSSGTKNRPIRAVTSIDWLVSSAMLRCVFYTAHDLFSCSHAVYDAILPATGGLSDLLVNAKLGIRTDRWFAREAPVDRWLEKKFNSLTANLVALIGNWFGPGVPGPEFIGVEDLGRIVSWILSKRQEGKNCCVRTAASNAARIAREAWRRGASLEGTKFIVSGEPFTEAKRAVIMRAGAVATTVYGGTGTGSAGYGCANPIYPDEVHVFQHRLAVIPHPLPHAGEGQPIQPLLFTTLSGSASRLLLNVENGDYAWMFERDCGCALEKVGLTLHLHHIRSFEKFTSEGMNYFYGDLYELFESILPSEFGGGPGDYQLVEEEDANGQTRLTLVVHPAVGEVDEKRMLGRLKAALSEGSRGNRFMAGVWENAGTFRIRRDIPHASHRGKILPLHFSQVGRATKADRTEDERQLA